MTRKQQFRSFMNRLDPKRNPKEALESDLYLEPEHASAKRIAASLDVRPNGTHLLIGPVGSGKTTELRSIERQLNAEGECFVHYVDVASLSDLSAFGPGVLLASVAVSMSDTLLLGRGQQSQIRSLAFGEDEPDYSDAIPGGRMVFRPGLLRRLGNRARLMAGIEDHLSMWKRESLQSHWVLLIDGLDRLPPRPDFADAIAKDVSALSKLDIGVVLVASIASLFGAAAEVRRQFDYTHAITPPSPPFVAQLLLRRGTPLLSKDAADLLAEYSGGGLRDAIALARSAGELAWLEGDDTVEVRHVKGAVETFGDALALGMDSATVDRLRAAMKTNTVSITSDADVNLLLEGRIVHDRPNHYSVHPALQAVLGPAP
jgi:energy-coupling factor transporter ATP-binding protein EcfA2